MELTATRKRKKIFSPLTVFLLVVLVLYALSLFGLIYWGIITTFKENLGDFTNNFGFKFPKEFYTDYYKYYFSEDFYRKTNGQYFFIEDMFMNSLLYAVGCAFTQTLVPCLTAYVCARYKQFKITKIYPIIVYITMIIPIVGSTASEIQLARDLHLYNEIWGLWIMKANFLGLYFLIFQSSFESLPDAFSEAAKIDGAGNFSILIRIMLPLVKNSFLTVFLIYFIQFWNDYQTPMLYLGGHPTIFYILYTFSINSGIPYSETVDVANACGVLTLAVLCMVPTSLVFLLFHNKLLGSVTIGGVK